MEHKIKIFVNHWQRVFDGTKTFEIRDNDRVYQKGDTVILTPVTSDGDYLTDFEGKGISGHINLCDLKRTIGDVYPIDSSRVVFSLLKEPS